MRWRSDHISVGVCSDTWRYEAPFLTPHTWWEWKHGATVPVSIGVWGSPHRLSVSLRRHSLRRQALLKYFLPPHPRRCMGTEDLCIVDRHDPRIRRCCGMQPRSTIATVSTAYTHVYAGVWGARIPALSTAITHIYAGVADVLYAGIEDPHITAITRVYAGVGTGCGD